MTEVYLDGEYWTNEPSTYALIPYGSALYGQVAVPAHLQAVPPSWVIEPFTAQSLNYSSIGVSWVKPAAAPQAQRWRLLSNRYGYPADQNDGSILLDSQQYPGSFYLDASVIPGAYQYYGLYVQTDTVTDVWVRAGVTGCLAIADTGAAGWLSSHLPPYFTQNLAGTLTQEADPNPALQQFLQVFGWGIDYARTQYNMLLSHLNDPMAIPISDLVNLATELGLPFDPMISVYLMRKAAANWSHVAQERGTQLGIVNQISLLTGFGVDLQIGANIMLEQDQSNFIDPVFPAWNAYTSYKSGEIVLYLGNIYQNSTNGTVGSVPTGGSPWTQVENTVYTADVLRNATTGGINTWEVVYPSLTNGIQTHNGNKSLDEAIGVPNPAAPSSLDANALLLINENGATEDMYVRSVSRTAAQITAGRMTTPFAPDKVQGINDGIPVPFTLPNQVWSPAVRYGTGAVTTYKGQPFVALRASTGATPPFSSSATNEWSALSHNTRLPLMVSAETEYVAASGGGAVPVTPFVEWYDPHGNFIDRVTARTTTTTAPWGNGTPGIPSNLALDSFLLNPGSSISGRAFDNAYGHTWTAQDSNFQVTGYNNGVAFPLTAGTRACALVTAPANGQVGVTFVTFAGLGAASANANPYFSDGALFPWTGWNANLSATTVVPAGSEFPWAGVAVPASSTVTQVGIQQSFPVTASATYNVSVDSYIQATDIDHLEISVQWFNGSTSLSSSTASLSSTNNAWAEYALSSISAPGTATQCILTVYGYINAGGDVAATDVLFFNDVTMTPVVTSAQNQGLIFRWSDENNYWKATPTALIKKVTGSFTTVATYSTDGQAGDRLVVQMNGSAITVLLNGVQVATATDAFNDTATQVGMIVE